MQCLVDAARFTDTGEVFRPGVVVSRLQLLQRNFVWRIAVNLIGAHHYENRIAAMLPGSFQQINGAKRVNFKIENGNIAGFVVGRLCGAMDYQIEAVALEQFIERIAITNIDAGMLKVLTGTLQPLQVPGGVTLCAKKQLAHVVVHADYTMALRVKMLHCFRTNESAAPGD